MDIKLNTKVTCPVTDAEGEVSFKMGTLVALNSRFATVEMGDGTKVKVGKTKIEPIIEEKPVKARRTAKYAFPEECPHCGIHLSNGVGHHGDDVNDEVIKHKRYQYACLGCGEEFGPEIKRAPLGDINSYEYENCTSYSGKPSKDNGDKTALELRGQSLEAVYDTAAGILGESVEELMAKYNHLNPGHQRMVLGNRIRGAK